MGHVKNKYKNQGILFFLIAIVFAGLVLQAEAGVPQVSEVMVTDITTRSFSLVWKSSEAATASLKVYDGSACNVETAGAVITPHPTNSGDAAIKTAAETSGVMKVMVAGLSSDTEYCYQTVTTSKSTSDVTTAPSVPAKVVTEFQTVRTYIEEGTNAIKPFSNDLIIFPVYQPDQITFSEGSLLIVEGPGGSRVSSFVGDGVSSPNALIDLNNLFTSTGTNMDIAGGEIVIIREFRGNNGKTESATLVRFREAPEDMELSMIKSPVPCFFADNDCNGRVEIIDVQRGFNLWGKLIGDNAYNTDLDIIADGTINIKDIQSIFNRFGQTEPF
jgi:hypothetical protein